MSTWYGKSKKFKLERFDPADYGYSHYEDVEYNWEYGTVSDYLRVTIKDSYEEKSISYPKLEAEAMLSTLIQWYSKYEGSGKLYKLIKEATDGQN